MPVLAALATTAGTPYLACVSATTPRPVSDADLHGANTARSAVTAGRAVPRSALGSVFSGIADGAAALRARPAAIRLVGADVMCSLVYGMQTVGSWETMHEPRLFSKIIVMVLLAGVARGRGAARFGAVIEEE